MDILGRWRSGDHAPRGALLIAFTVYFGLAVFLVIAFGFVVHHLGRERASAEESARVELVSEITRTTLANVNRDLETLLSSTALNNYLQSPTPHNTRTLGQTFNTFLSHTGNYDQVRILSMTGKEKVRANYNDGHPEQVAEHHLQDKSERYYFESAASSPVGATYISPIDPNMERGEVQIPLKAVMRFSRILTTTEGDVAGVLMLNYRADNMLDFWGHVYSGKGASLVLQSGAGCWSKTPRDKIWNFHRGVNTSRCKKVSSNHATGALFETRAHDSSDLVTSSSHTSMPADNGKIPLWQLSSIIPAEELRYDPLDFIRLHPDASLLGLIIILFTSAATARLRIRALDQKRQTQISEARFRELFERAPEGILISDSDGRYTHVNHTAAQLLGRSSEELTGMTALDVTPEAEHERLSNFFKLGKSTSQQAEWDLLLPTGEHMPVEAISSLLPDGGHQIFFRDITHRRHSEQQMRLAHTVFDGTNEPIMICNETLDIVAANPAFHRRFTTDNDFMYLADYDSSVRARLDPHRFKNHVRESLNGRQHWEGEMSFEQADGSAIYMWAVISTVEDTHGNVSNYVIILADISPLKQTEFQLRQLAHLDPLTGLANRAAFELIARQSLEKSRITGESGAFMMLDLDKFKQVNDSLGHAAGDKLLISIANKLTKAVRNIDTVVRLGGDEFCIVLPGIRDQGAAAAIANKIAEAVREPIELKNAAIQTSTSIGIAMYPSDSLDLDILMEAADQAMYKAKSAGRDDFYFYAETRRHASS